MARKRVSVPGTAGAGVAVPLLLAKGTSTGNALWNTNVQPGLSGEAKSPVQCPVPTQSLESPLWALVLSLQVSSFHPQSSWCTVRRATVRKLESLTTYLPSSCFTKVQIILKSWESMWILVEFTVFFIHVLQRYCVKWAILRTIAWENILRHFFLTFFLHRSK